MEYITDDNVIVVYSNVGLGDKLIFFVALFLKFLIKYYDKF